MPGPGSRAGIWPRRFPGALGDCGLGKKCVACLADRLADRLTGRLTVPRDRQAGGAGSLESGTGIRPGRLHEEFLQVVRHSCRQEEI